MKKLLYTLAAVLVPSLAMAQTYTENFVKNTTHQVKTKDGEHRDGTTTDLTADEKIESITYFDGLGRPKQSVGIRAGGNREDVVVYIGYDAYGRQDKEYLPYATTTNEGLYRNDAFNPTFDFYNTTKYENTLNPYSEKHLEASPLNRVLEQGAPGADWAVNKTADTDHTIKFGYGTNTVSDYVRRFSVSFQNGDTKIPQLVENPEMVYDPSELYKTVTKDENWKPNQTYPKDHTTEEYKDKQGRVILKRTFDSKRWLDTYYVYDDFGNLTYVIPPKVMTYSSILQPYIEQEFEYSWDLGEVFVNNSGYGNFSIIELDGKLDIYWYFGGNYSTSVFKNFVIPLNFTPALPNMAIGTINGPSGVAASVFIQDGNLHIQSTGNPVSSADLEKYILLNLTNYQSNYTPSVIDTSILNGLCYQYRYDERNRLIEKKIPGKGTTTDWEEIVYNKLDQPILTRDPNLKVQGKWLFTKYDAFGRVAYTGIMNSTDTRANLQLDADATTLSQFETKSYPISVGGATIVYANNSYPQTISEVHTINYYDNYSFDGFTNLPSSIDGQPVVNYNNASATQKQTKGLATCSKVRVLNGSSPAQWITTVTGYDKKGRPLYVKSVNDYLGTTDIVENTLDFVGKVDKTKTSHVKGTTNIVTEDLFTYDHVGRLKKQTQELNNTNTLEVIVENHYDELGQLDNKGVGGKSTQGRLQTVNYSYNIRGWLKQVNYPTTLGNDLFTFKLNYNTPGHGATALYNGNISETEWRTANIDSALKWYKYSYDAINRLTQARDNANQYFVGGYYSYSPFIKYDRNGNIKSLTRSGFNEDTNTYAGVIDNLNYMYADNSNQLLKVTDVAYGAAKVFGFKDGNTNGDDYSYDADGNMVEDKNKGITSITYNHLNLPTSVNFSVNGSQGPGTISYIYDAVGTKLKKVVSAGIETTTVYAGNYVYVKPDGSSEILKFFNQAEGYIEPKNENNLSQGFDYVYQYKDHLGNIRLSYKDVSTTSTPVLEILEENNYYPFGLRHSGYNNSPVTNHPYKYNGVELNESLGLNLYEMDVRSYDPAIARWTSIDPVTHYSQSTYTAFDNNPVFWADPMGTTTVNSIQEAWDATPEGGGSTWFNDGNGGLTDDPQEGQTKEELGHVVDIDGMRASSTTYYYHSGGINGSKSGWYTEAQYAQIVKPVAFELAVRVYGWNSKYGTSMMFSGYLDSFIESRTFANGYFGFLLAYGNSVKGAEERRANYMASGHTKPMGLDSPFFIGAFGAASKFLGLRGAAATSSLPTQMHHFATNKNKVWTPLMENIAGRFGLNLNGAWNKMALPHLGRHPNEYHKFVYDGMVRAAAGAGGNQAKFIQLFQAYVKNPVIKNPQLLRKAGWQ